MEQAGTTKSDASLDDVCVCEHKKRDHAPMSVGTAVFLVCARCSCGRVGYCPKDGIPLQSRRAYETASLARKEAEMRAADLAVECSGYAETIARLEGEEREALEKIARLERELAEAKANHEAAKIVGVEGVKAGTPPPVPMYLTCPKCNARHVDEGEFATKPHHTHSCQSCGLTWRPAVGPTVGVPFLPGFKNEPEAAVLGTPAPTEAKEPDGYGPPEQEPRRSRLIDMLLSEAKKPDPFERKTGGDMYEPIARIYAANALDKLESDARLRAEVTALDTLHEIACKERDDLRTKLATAVEDLKRINLACDTFQQASEISMRDAKAAKERLAAAEKSAAEIRNAALEEAAKRVEGEIGVGRSGVWMAVFLRELKSTGGPPKPSGPAPCAHDRATELSGLWCDNCHAVLGGDKSHWILPARPVVRESDSEGGEFTRCETHIPNSFFACLWCPECGERVRLAPKGGYEILP